MSSHSFTHAERQAISKGWLRAAEESLTAASELRAAGHYRSSVCRSYYAAYSFVAAKLVLIPGVNFPDDREGPHHEPLSDLVALHFKKMYGTSTRSMIRIGVRALYESRLISDYRPRLSVREGLAVDALQKASAIAKTIRS